MTYYSSASGMISRERALDEVRRHGALVSEFLADCGDCQSYRARAVLQWLGY